MHESEFVGACMHRGMHVWVHAYLHECMHGSQCMGVGVCMHSLCFLYQDLSVCSLACLVSLQTVYVRNFFLQSFLTVIAEGHLAVGFIVT